MSEGFFTAVRRNKDDNDLGCLLFLGCGVAQRDGGRLWVLLLLIFRELKDEGAAVGR